MGDLINLRTKRKQAKRQQALEQAAENRHLHGEPKMERAIRATLEDNARRHLDQHRIDKGEDQ
jgi:hypothetical protein